MKLFGLLFGFIFTILGLLIAIHSTHHIVGLLITFGGFYMTLMSLPHYGERIL